MGRDQPRTFDDRVRHCACVERSGNAVYKRDRRLPPRQSGAERRVTKFVEDCLRLLRVTTTSVKSE